MKYRPHVALLLVALGCAPPATIRLRNGANVESPIIGSDRDSVYVRGMYGEPHPIPRQEIVDIDHPGNVGTVAGLLLMAWGMAVLTSDPPKDSNPGEVIVDAFADVFLGTMLIVGGATETIIGSAIYLQSTGAASDTRPPRRRRGPPLPQPLPLVPPPPSPPPSP
jgi:hypothetical protein